jgi:hypothetical protein
LCTTSIDDLEKCVQRSKETTRKWLRRWQDTWVPSSGVHPTLTVNTFKRCCRYEPLVVKIKRVLNKSTTNLLLLELIEITWCYAQEDPMPNSDDESTMRINPSHGGPSRQDRHGQDLRYNNTRHTGKCSGPSDLVANAGQTSPRDSKAFHRNGGSYHDGNMNYRGKNPNKPKFGPEAMLNEPCIMHSSPSHPVNHSTKDCHTLKEVERARPKNLRVGDQPKDKNNGNDFGRDVSSLHTFTGTGDRHNKKKLNRVVAEHAVTSADVACYLDWSKQPIGWSHADQATPIEYLGCCALIVRPKWLITGSQRH